MHTYQTALHAALVRISLLIVHVTSNACHPHDSTVTDACEQFSGCLWVSEDVLDNNDAGSTLLTGTNSAAGKNLTSSMMITVRRCRVGEVSAAAGDECMACR
jgi:hypothetical protein